MIRREMKHLLSLEVGWAMAHLAPLVNEPCFLNRVIYEKCSTWSPFSIHEQKMDGYSTVVMSVHLLTIKL